MLQSGGPEKVTILCGVATRTYSCYISASSCSENLQRLFNSLEGSLNKSDKVVVAGEFNAAAIYWRISFDETPANNDGYKPTFHKSG